ncbi:translocation/assembly module TamB domain-containing protein [Sphingomonas sp. S1-29]|uniref:translocation/assembly module TamB domain-containing protein n=1 Tax=Sphingomonas sp. S1-29 TaxID=2991074 RepID=UPI002240406E|nr:translocation/assembly module TamB domain-containing protein [Sphingomonas sp. S1-29]UZK69614.1 translocation/assembly module TamB domain-containing protein [Sphingomonas sp. S1-29]
MTDTMVHDQPDAPHDEHIVVRAPLWQRILKWVGIAIGVIALLLLVIVAVMNTAPGRRFVADQINGYTLASGLNIQVGRIEGSLYGSMVLRDVRIRDQRGVFATSPSLAVDWRPFAFASNHVDIRSLTSPLVRVARLPELKETPSDPDAPLLPDLDIDVNRLAIERIELAPAVAGQRYIARIDSEVHIADRRAQLTANAATIAAAGVAGGDRLTLALDAVPDDDRFDVDLKLNAPAGGMIGSMASLKAPLFVTIDGQGTWARWTGRLAGTLGGQSLANIGITARDGFFQVRGRAQPGVYLEGPVERLTSPALQVALDARLLENRRLDTQLRLRSDALAVSTQGLLDLGRSRFEGFRAEALLLTPGAILENLNGNAVRAQVALDGAFATPTVDYKLQAAAIGFGETVVEQLYAEGRATVNADRILVPVSARAARVSGLNAAVGGLVTNVTINGDLAYSGDQILSDNLRIRSDRIDATAIIVADLGSGRYTGALKGRVNDYELASIGILDLSTDADVVATADGYGIRGRVVAQTKRLFNDGIRNFLGGNATTAANVSMGPDGIVRFDNLRLNAPQFRITRGSGQYDFAGPLLVNADAVSTQYGPISARVSGSVAAPVVLVRAPRPGVGVGLTNLVANIRGQGEGYAIKATGGTDYGPFNANVLLRTAPRLTADIRDTVFAGININGRVAATDAGPFTGALNFSGSGVNGIARLGAVGRYQSANVSARAYNARIPGDAGLTIGRAIIDGSVVLYDDAPAVVFDAQVANFRQGEFVVTQARARGNYRGGNGTVTALARGSSGVPFEIAANARLSPNQYLVALKGTGNGIDFRTAQPARIVPVNGGYRLFPTRLDFDNGSARVAGTYGNGMSVQARLDKLDLAVANAFVPGLGLGGSATGSFEANQAAGAAFPTGTARIEIDNFTRSSLATVSAPVDIQAIGTLGSGRSDLRAIVQRGGATIGRVVAGFTPGSGGYAQAPLTGGIRYNGPSDVLFSLSGIADQQVSGPVGIAADFSGTVGAPRIAGVVRANNLTYENETYGTRLTAMRVNGRFNNDRFELTEVRATAGEGSVTAQGYVGLAANSGFPIDIRAKLDNARLARSDALGATATGNIHLTNGANGGLIEGDILIPEARYQVIRQGAAEVAVLTGVRRRGEVVRAADDGDDTPSGPPGLFRLAINVRADNRLYVSGMGLESEWEADLRVGGTSAAPRITGTIEVVRGTYSFSGKRFDLTRGVISYEGNNLTNPNIAISASTTTEGVTAIINVTGTAQRPQVAFTSTPALAQDEVLSRVLFGSSVTNLSAIQAIQLASALNSLRGSGGGLNPLGELRQAGGIDRLRIVGGDEATGRGTALSAGQYLTDDIYVEIITDARGFTATQLEVALTKTLSVLSQTGSFGGSSVNFRYSRDY